MKSTIRYSGPPTSWRSLQDHVCQIFADMGYKATVGKKVSIARGKAEIDVLAQKGRHKVVCECKYWKSRVPQSVVHSFATVVQNYGANAGYVIAQSGFNSGAYRSARYTNIRLLTWNEFKDFFEEDWLRGISARIRHDFSFLMDCTEPIIATGIFKRAEQLSKAKKERFKKLRNTHIELGTFVLMFSMLDLHPNRLTTLRFPIVVPVGKTRYRFNSSWEVIDWLYTEGIAIQKRFRKALR